MLPRRQTAAARPVALLRQRNTGGPTLCGVGRCPAVPGQYPLPQRQPQLLRQLLRQQPGLVISPVTLPLRRHRHIGHGGQLRQQSALPHRSGQHPAEKRQAFPHALKFQLLHPPAEHPLVSGAPQKLPAAEHLRLPKKIPHLRQLLPAGRTHLLLPAAQGAAQTAPGRVQQVPYYVPQRHIIPPPSPAASLFDWYSAGCGGRSAPWRTPFPSARS